MPYIASSRTSTGGRIGTKPSPDERGRGRSGRARARRARRRRRGTRSASPTAAPPRSRSIQPRPAASSRWSAARTRTRAARRPAASSPRVVLRRAVGRRWIRGSARGRAAPAGERGLLELRLDARSSAFTPRSCSSSSGVGFPSVFVCARSSLACVSSSRQRSSAASSSSNGSARSLALERGAEPLGVGPRGSEIDQPRSGSGRRRDRRSALPRASGRSSASRRVRPSRRRRSGWDRLLREGVERLAGGLRVAVSLSRSGPMVPFGSPAGRCGNRRSPATGRARRRPLRRRARRSRPWSSPRSLQPSPRSEGPPALHRNRRAGARA